MIIGRFYFRLTTSGNLIGEFSNQTSQRNWTESADREHGDVASFQGDFKTTWQEAGNPLLAKLNIARKTDATNIFSLTWTIGNRTLYIGEAMIAEDLLIGDYRDPEVPV